jgi:hypothetical protein
METVPEAKLFLLLQLYNDMVGKVNWKCALKVYINKPAISSYSWYPDLCNLHKILQALGAKPREYISFQIQYHTNTVKFGRTVPTIRMLTTPAAVERWEKHKSGPRIDHVSRNDIIQSSTRHMANIMHANGLDELSFFQNPLFIGEVSKVFLAQNETFRTLLASGYYHKHFGLSATDLI